MQVDLDALKALLAKATQGTWKLTISKGGRYQISNGNVQVAAIWHTTNNRATATGDCIADLHNAAPDLIAEVEAAREALKAAKAALENAQQASGSRLFHESRRTALAAITAYEEKHHG